MPPRPESEERDYLALAKLPVDHRSFIERTREAFLLEHGCVFDYQIAGVVGRDKSRIAQIFKNPQKVDAQTIHYLVDALTSREHRRLILQSWTTLCFGEELASLDSEVLVGSVVSEKIIKRLDRMIRQNRLATAARIALDSHDRTDDDMLVMRLLDRAYFALQRLDRPGSAMRVARRITDHGTAANDMRRSATGHFLRVRILRGMGDSVLSDVLPILDEIEHALTLAHSMPDPRPLYMLVSDAQLATERINTQVTFIERRQLSVEPGQLQEWLTLLLLSAKQTRVFQSRAGFLQLAARIQLLLGETFQAQELLEQSFDSGVHKNLNASEMAGLIQGRILALTDSPEQASAYLQQVIANCRKTSDLYHQRLAEHDLARLESAEFPAIR